MFFIFFTWFLCYTFGKRGNREKMNEEQYYKISDVMKVLNVKSAATILKAIKAGQLEAIQVGAQWRFPREQFNNMGTDK
jgi:excisionase family DNA binding protein